MLAQALNASVSAGREYPLGTWTGGQAHSSETEVIFRLPPHAARFGVVVMAHGRGSSGRTGTYIWVDYAGPLAHSAVVGAHSGGSSAGSDLQYGRVMPGVNLRGMDLRVVGGYTGNWSSCRALCASTAACQAWTWCRDCPAPTSKCCLKSGLPSPSRPNASGTDPTTEIVSGVMQPELIDTCPLGSNVSACRPTDELRLGPTESTIALRVFVDQTFAEAYFQNGRSVLTVSVAPSTDPAALASVALAVTPEEGGGGGGVVVAESARVWSVKGIWASAEQVRATPRLG